MYILDTNVISELRKAHSGKADTSVIVWANSVHASTLFASVISLMELELGILSLGRKDQAQAAMLRKWFEGAVLPEFSKRTLSVDTQVALLCAKLHVPDKRSERDALIAATAIAHSMTVVTRNTSDFQQTGASLLNPWLWTENGNISTS